MVASRSSSQRTSARARLRVTVQHACQARRSNDDAPSGSSLERRCRQRRPSIQRSAGRCLRQSCRCYGSPRFRQGTSDWRELGRGGSICAAQSDRDRGASLGHDSTSEASLSLQPLDDQRVGRGGSLARSTVERRQDEHVAEESQRENGQDLMRNVLPRLPERGDVFWRRRMKHAPVAGLALHLGRRGGPCFGVPNEADMIRRSSGGVRCWVRCFVERTTTISIAEDLVRRVDSFEGGFRPWIAAVAVRMVLQREQAKASPNFALARVASDAQYHVRIIHDAP
jgi:hypothetical protein